MNLTVLLIAAFLPLPVLLFMILRSGSFGKGSIGTMLKLFFLGVASAVPAFLMEAGCLLVISVFLGLFPDCRQGRLGLQVFLELFPGKGAGLRLGLFLRLVLGIFLRFVPGFFLRLVLEFFSSLPGRRGRRRIHVRDDSLALGRSFRRLFLRLRPALGRVGFEPRQEAPLFVFQLGRPDALVAAGRLPAQKTVGQRRGRKAKPRQNEPEGKAP